MAARTSGSEGVRTEGADVKNLSKFSPFLPPCENGTRTKKKISWVKFTSIKYQADCVDALDDSLAL